MSKPKFQSETNAVKSQAEDLKKSEVEEKSKPLKFENTAKSLEGQMMYSKIKRCSTVDDLTFESPPSEGPIKSIAEDDEESDDGHNYAVLSENGGWQIIPPL